MKVLIVGGEGGMGKRYRAVLNHLQVEHESYDIHEDYELEVAADSATAAIIATPTSTHLDVVEQLLPFDIPILCEKPFSKNFEQLGDLLGAAKNSQIAMVNQYRFMSIGAEQLTTRYDYFKSGGDGLIWDCINIIGLAKGEIILGNKSPIWKCKINGRHLDISEMDAAYVFMISEWLKNPTYDHRYILEAHKKVIQMVEANDEYH
jgi:hypothetical protein